MESAESPELNPGYIIRLLEPDDVVTKLSLGRADCRPLKTFLEQDAHHYHANNITKTYVLVEEGGNVVKGYISIICSEMKLDGSEPAVEPDYKYDSYPAVKIARLALHQKLHGKGYGRDMVNLAISKAVDEIMPAAGCRLMIVDSKKHAVEKYEGWGFTMLDTDSNKEDEHPILYIDLQELDNLGAMREAV